MTNTATMALKENALHELGGIYPFVTVVVPCRDEADYIDACLQSLTQDQDYPGQIEFLVADGRSRDGTRSVVERWTARDPRIRLIDNEQGIVPTGLNRAILSARGDVIVRADAHSEYAADYISQCVKHLLLTGAQNVGGPMRTRGRSYFQKAVCLATHSWISLGGALSKNLHYEGEVDSVQYGCWNRETLLKMGLFDEAFVRNQDDELNFRIIRGGGKIWQTPNIKSWIYPRNSVRKLFRQYWQYGYWKVRVIQKHGRPAALRHLVPTTFVLFLVLLAVASPFYTSALYAFMAVASAYIAGMLLAGVAASNSLASLKYVPGFMAAVSIIHIGYGIGFLRGVIDSLFLRHRSATVSTMITR